MAMIVNDKWIFFTAEIPITEGRRPLVMGMFARQSEPPWRSGRGIAVRVGLAHARAFGVWVAPPRWRRDYDERLRHTLRPPKSWHRRSWRNLWQDLTKGSASMYTSDVLLPTTVPGTAATGVLARYVLPFNATIVSAVTSAGTAPAGSGLIADVRVDGTTIFGGVDLPTIAAGGNNSPLVRSQNTKILPVGTLVTVHVTAVGSGTAGAGLTVLLHLRKS